MMVLSKRKKLLIVIGVPLVLIVVFLLRERICEWSVVLGKCVFHEITGFHCPGCGNTRSVKAMLRGDIVLAFRNNPMMPILSASLVLLYAEVVFDLCGKKVKLLPRNLWLWGGIFAVLMAFYILRNFIPALAPIVE